MNKKHEHPCLSFQMGWRPYLTDAPELIKEKLPPNRMSGERLHLWLPGPLLMSVLCDTDAPGISWGQIWPQDSDPRKNHPIWHFSSNEDWHQNFQRGASKMAEWIKTFAANTADLSSTPGAHVAERISRCCGGTRLQF